MYNNKKFEVDNFTKKYVSKDNLDFLSKQDNKCIEHKVITNLRGMILVEASHSDDVGKNKFDFINSWPR